MYKTAKYLQTLLYLRPVIENMQKILEVKWRIFGLDAYAQMNIQFPAFLHCMADSFSSEERSALEEHFSNTDKSIFAITTTSQTDRGALMARYSRSSKSMRRIFLDEFLNNPQRGPKFYENVLVEYGDDSVAELGQTQIAIEGISNIAVKKIEDRRIGLSFLEKSSRYVSWAQKIDDNYQYYVDPQIAESRHADAYIAACNLSFDTYVKCMTPMKKYTREKYPIEEQTFYDSKTRSEQPFSRLHLESDISSAHKAYERSIRARSLDALRGLLPASATTNVGIAGNGRAFEYLISVLLSSDLYEERHTGRRILEEIGMVMGPFVRRAQDKYGQDLQKYIKSTKWSIPLQPQPITCSTVKLVDCPDESNAIDTVVSGLLYEESGSLFGAVLENVRRMGPEKKSNIIERFGIMRKNRRHRPPRAFELVPYTFDIVSNFGMFRDIHRHRILTMQRQRLSTHFGYHTPPEIDAMGYSREFAECMESTRDIFESMEKQMPHQAQYVVNFAYNYPYMMQINLRELCHLVELRTTPQGHPDYRQMAQEMYHMAASRHPTLSRIIKFANMSGYQIGRLDGEKRIERKRSRDKN